MQGRKELKIETHCVSCILIITLLHLLIFYQEQLNYIFRDFFLCYRERQRHFT